MKNPGRVKSIFIEKLFGLYDHRIELKEERVTILHGPNGVGKTTLFKLVDGVLRGDFKVCGDVPFLKLEIGFEGGMLSVHREGIAEPRWRKEERPIVMRWDGDGDVREHRFGGDLPSSLNKVEERLENLWRSVWGPPEDIAFVKPEWYSSIDATFIGIERLLHFSEPDRQDRVLVEKAVDLRASSMKALIEASLARYGTESEQQERSLPLRLASSSRQLLPVEEIRSRLEDLDRERKRLQALDLLEGDVGPSFDPATIPSDPVTEAVLSLHVLDTHTKLSIFADFAHRLEIFRDALNSKFLDKKIRISRELGLVVTSINGDVLDLAGLSSGEQHELVLLFDLLFQTPANTLVLIDEPELSMHPSWKRNFLRDVLEVAAVAKIDVILATHSVQIVNGRHDLMVALAGDQH